MQRIFLRRANIILISIIIVASCNENPVVTNSIYYQPIDLNDGWLISTAEEQGVNEDVLVTAYRNAGNLDNIYSLLVIKNGYLIAEKYFNGATFLEQNGIASTTKSITSALTGIALREGFLNNIEQKMEEFFPEINFENLDPRKSNITIRHILQMRSGYPWEEFDGYLDEYLSTTYFIPFIEEFPLMYDPGTHFGYSMTTSHLMGIILARASESDLRSFYQTYLFDLLGITIGNWYTDSLGYYYSGGTMCLSPREMARFGQLYLDSGVYSGDQIVPSEWVEESLQTYSAHTYDTDIFVNIHQLGYGYYWWSGFSGTHQFNFAWGHGGQMIAIVSDIDLVVVVTARGSSGFGAEVWQNEKSVMEIVGRLIGSL